MDGPRDQLNRLALVVLLTGTSLLGGACRPAAAAREERGAAIDRPVPREVALATFRDGTAAPNALAGGARSRDVLIARFLDALAARDTAALVTMAMTRAEFAWLYYATNPQALPPYDLSPDLMWFLHEGNSEMGLRRLLHERAGRDLGVVGYRCDAAVSHQGENTVMGPCALRRVVAGRDTVEERLFGLIIERGGRFKFVSYANKL